MSGPSSCSRCGGSLPSPDDDGNIVCPSCGLFHHVGDDPPPVTGSPAGAVPPPSGPAGPFGSGASSGGASVGGAASSGGVPTFGSAPTFGAAPPVGGTPGVKVGRTRRGPGLGCLIAVVILIATLVPVGFAVVQAGRAISRAGDGRSDLELTVTTGDSEVVVDAEGRPREIVALAQPVGSSSRVIARATVAGDVRWRASVVPADVYSAQLRVTDALVLASLGDEVIALDGATGATRWRATMPDEVDPRCRDCVAVLGDSLVVFSRDASITVVALADGTSRWTRRLASPSGSIHIVGERLLVLDEPVDGRAPAALTITDVATGDERGRIDPSCPDPNYPPEQGQTIDLETGSQVLPVPGTDDVVLVFGFVTTCIQRWSLPESQMRWSGVTDLGTTFTDPTVVTDGTDMVIADPSLLVHISLSEGSVEALPVPADTSPSGAAALSGGRLVTAVRSTRGTARWTLIALDLRTRATLWERPLGRGVEAFDLADDRSSDTLFTGNARFLLAPTGSHEVALVTLASPGQRLTVEGIDAATGRGRALGRSTFALRYESSTSPSARIERITAGHVVFTTEGIPQVLDLATGRITASWAD